MFPAIIQEITLYLIFKHLAKIRRMLVDFVQNILFGVHKNN